MYENICLLRKLNFCGKAFLLSILNHSAMRKVHLVNRRVVYVYWIDTVFVQNNLPTEFSKITIFII